MLTWPTVTFYKPLTLLCSLVSKVGLMWACTDYRSERTETPWYRAGAHYAFGLWKELFINYMELLRELKCSFLGTGTLLQVP